MRLAGTARAHEEQAAAFIRRRPRVDELFDASLGILQRRSLGSERFDGAVLVAARDGGRGEALVAAQNALTVAGLDAEGIARQRNPSRTLAARAGGGGGRGHGR